MLKLRLIGLWGIVVLGAAVCVHASELIGSHDNNPTTDGFDALSGSYDVPADANNVPRATFNSNANDGLYAGGTGTSVTVEGGQFDGNFTSGIESGSGASISITSGVFNNNGDEAVFVNKSSVINIYGGQFLDNGNIGLVAAGGTINLYGGQLNGNAQFDVYAESGGTVNVFGAFNGVADGQVVNLTSNASSFYGQLEGNSSPQEYTYATIRGTISLHGTSTLVPEPAAVILIPLAGGALLIGRRRYAGY